MISRATAWPQTAFTKLVYTDTFTLTVATSTTLKSTIYRANSLFDPDYTGGGTVAVGLAQWDDMYKNYRVRGCSVHATFFDISAAADNQGFAFIRWNDSQNIGRQFAATDAIDVVRQSRALVKVRGNNTGTAPLRFKTYRSMWSLEGFDKKINDKSFLAATTANPVDSNSFEIGVVGVKAPAAARDTIVSIQITYYVKFEAPKVAT